MVSVEYSLTSRHSQCHAILNKVYFELFTISHLEDNLKLCVGFMIVFLKERRLIKIIRHNIFNVYLYYLLDIIKVLQYVLFICNSTGKDD